MDIDYEAAMVVRAELRAQIAADIAARRATNPAPATDSTIPQVIRFQPVAPKPSPVVGRPVRMAVAARNGLVGLHFGHAREFLVYEASATGVRLLGHRKVDSYCSGDESCGDADSLLARTIAALDGCEVVLCSRIGYEPWETLAAAGIQPNGEHAMQPIEEAVTAVWHEMLAAGKLAVTPAAAKRA